LPDVARRIRALAQQTDVVYSYREHAQVEMRNDKISRVDIQNGLQRCSVARQELHGIVWRETVRFRCSDGDDVYVVVQVDEEERRIDVVTAWRCNVGRDTARVRRRRR
jgi:hypothetical protein